MSYCSPSVEGSDKFLDVDFMSYAEQHGAEMEDGKLGFGWVPDSDDDLMAATPFEAVEDLIPEAEWKDRIAELDADPHGGIERWIRHIFNQGREPSCTHNASAQGLFLGQARVFGPDFAVVTSPISSYRWNGTRYSGSSVAGALNWLREVGQLPARTEENLAHVAAGWFKHTHPFTGYGEPFQDGWKDTAKLLRVDEYLKLTSVEAWVTASIKGYPCIGGRNKHCICHVRPVWDGGIFSDYVNSWGNWGFERQIWTGTSKGFGRDSRNKIATMTARGAWAVRSVYVPPWYSVVA
jgi:hypothetical protein